MNLLVLPDDGLGAVVRALRKAKKAVQVAIFRCDLRESRRRSETPSRAASRCTLIAHTNRTGEKKLRELELRLARPA
jgi:hypothetical protein